jgi:hypothetical protein
MNESNSDCDPDVNPTGSKTIKYPLQDARSPFFLHPSKIPGAVLVSWINMVLSWITRTLSPHIFQSTICNLIVVNLATGE